MESATVAIATSGERARIEQWHRNRVAALEAQMSRVQHGRNLPRHESVQVRYADLAAEAQRHRDFLASFGQPTTPPRTPREARIDRAMSADWRNQLNRAAVALAV